MLKVQLEDKLTKIYSILMLLSNDIDNPSGSCVESIHQEAIDIALEMLDSIIDILQENNK